MSSILSSASEQARLEALRRSQLLDTPPEEAFDRLTRLAARIFGVPTALITLVDDRRQWFKSCYGFDLQETLRDISFCTHTLEIAPEDVLVVPDATGDPRFQNNPLVTGWPHIRFYAGAPLRTPEGYVLGNLCLIDTHARAPLSRVEQELLRDLAAVVMDTVQQRLLGEDLRHTRQHLEHRQQQVELTLAKTRTVLWTLDLKSGTLQVQADAKALGLPEGIIPTSLQELLALMHPEDRTAAQAHIAQVRQEGGPYDTEARLQFPGGQVFRVRSRGSVQRDEQGQPARLLAVTFDISQQHLAEQALRQSEALLGAVIENTQDAIYIKDVQGRYLLVNPAAAALMNAAPDEVIGQTDADFLSPSEYQRVIQVDQQVMTQTQAATYEYPLVFGAQNLTMLTSKFPLMQGGEVRGLVGVSRDITAQKDLERRLREANSTLETRIEERTRALAELNAQLQHDAFHDALTGLPNRALFMDRLTQAVERKANADRNNFAVLFLDLDQFKLVNDSLGHAAGDELLIEIAQRLQVNIAAVNTAARLGGDEFTVLLEDVHSREEVEQRVKALQQLLARPFQVAGHHLQLTASIGITLCDQRYQQAEDVVRDADIAMYRAKTEFKGRYVFFEPAMRHRRVALMNLQRDLRRALDQGEFQVYYQPILRLTDQTVAGVEALVRWKHPEHGLISPAEFIPLAEESGMICDIDLWVLREACRQLRRWNAGRAFPLHLNVNLSAQHFAQSGLVKQVRWVLAEEAITPQWLHLEITESLLMTQGQIANDMLRQLREIGTKIVLDDFGTGYSGLSYLQKFPLDGLKIDRSFITSLEHQPEVLQTIILLGQHLKMHVVAEGIEESIQVSQLRDMVCEFGQGYFFARPMPTHELTSFLQTYTPALDLGSSIT